MLYGMALQIEKRPILNTNLFISLVQIIKENQSGIRNTSGTQLKNPVTDTVVYTPPEGEKVIRDKLKNLEDFIHAEDDLDPLVKWQLFITNLKQFTLSLMEMDGRIILLLYLK
jgi:hypothetical protein